MMRLDGGGQPHLVVLAPDSERGREIPLDRAYLVVGREPACDVRFEDPRVSQRRESFLREVAATRTRARWLAWTGPLLFAAGFAAFAADLSFLKGISVGRTLAALGLILLVVGIVLHVVAASRRRHRSRPPGAAG